MTFESTDASQEYPIPNSLYDFHNKQTGPMNWESYGERRLSDAPIWHQRDLNV